MHAPFLTPRAPWSWRCSWCGCGSGTRPSGPSGPVPPSHPCGLRRADAAQLDRAVLASSFSTGGRPWACAWHSCRCSRPGGGRGAAVAGLALAPVRGGQRRRAHGHGRLTDRLGRKPLAPRVWWCAGSQRSAWASAPVVAFARCPASGVGSGRLTPARPGSWPT
ncbi:hypothetical protein QJS66_01005 [Kocuria rhizophila]|nr:hypothetical protein QJS66_01005 [Kocuria rhizophila]